VRVHDSIDLMPTPPPLFQSTQTRTRTQCEQKAKKEGGGGGGKELQEEDIEAILNEVSQSPESVGVKAVSDDGEVDGGA
jgi:hypothetical protein